MTILIIKLLNKMEDIFHIYHIKAFNKKHVLKSRAIDTLQKQIDKLKSL